MTSAHLLLRWALIGLALDAVALVLLWLTAGALGLGDHLGSAWPVATGFVTIPWLCHILLLPALAGGPRPTAGRAAAMTAAYVVGAAFLIPAVAALVVIVMEYSGLFRWPVWNYFGGLLGKQVADLLSATALIVVWTGPVGAAIGAMGGLFRRGLYEPSADVPPWSADALGGFVAAPIAFILFALSDSLGLLDLAPHGDFAGSPMVSPALGTAVGLIAFTPHLLLTAPLNPRRATSACGAAPSAPSR